MPTDALNSIDETAKFYRLQSKVVDWQNRYSRKEAELEEVTG
jgi:hypothetical protein